MTWRPSKGVNSCRKFPRNVVAPLSKRQYLRAVHRSGEGCFQWLAGVFGCGIFGPDLLEWALLHADGIECSRGKLDVFDDYHPDAEASFHMAAQTIQEMVLQKGALELFLSGPVGLCNKLRKAFLPGGKYAVDQPCMVAIVSLFDLPRIGTTQLSDVDFNKEAHHDGPSQQLCTTFASMASANGVPCSSVSPSTSSSEPVSLIWTPIVPLPPLMIEADDLCVRSKDQGCSVTGGVQVASSIGCFSEIVRGIWKETTEAQPIVMRPDVTSTITNDKTASATASVPIRTLKSKRLSQPLALDTRILKSRDHDYFARKRVPSLGRIPEMPEEFQSPELKQSTEAQSTEASDDSSCSESSSELEQSTEASDDSSCSESNSDPCESRSDVSDSLRESSIKSSPRDNFMYSCDEQSEEQLSSKTFKERVAELKKRASTTSSELEKLLNC